MLLLVYCRILCNITSRTILNSISFVLSWVIKIGFMDVLILYPVQTDVVTGNSCSAEQWAEILIKLGHCCRQAGRITGRFKCGKNAWGNRGFLARKPVVQNRSDPHWNRYISGSF